MCIDQERERERDVFVFCWHVVQYSDVCLIQLLILHNTVHDDPIDLCEHLLGLLLIEFISDHIEVFGVFSWNFPSYSTSSLGKLYIL